MENKIDFFPKKKVLPWNQAANEIVEFCRLHKPWQLKKEQNPWCRQYEDCKDCIIDFFNSRIEGTQGS